MVYPLRAFEGSQGEDHPTLGKMFQPGNDTLSWSFGRHPEYCDVVLTCAFVSAIHFVIFHDRGMGQWFIQDGGYYPRPLQDRRSKRLYRMAGYDASTAGTYLNGTRLEIIPPTDTQPLQPRKMPLYEGDRIYAAGEKIVVTTTDHLPQGFDWATTWIMTSEPKEVERLTPRQNEELMQHQRQKVSPDGQATAAGVISAYLSALPLWAQLFVWLIVGAVAIAVLAFLLR